MLDCDHVMCKECYTNVQSSDQLIDHYYDNAMDFIRFSDTFSDTLSVYGDSDDDLNYTGASSVYREWAINHRQTQLLALTLDLDDESRQLHENFTQSIIVSSITSENPQDSDTRQENDVISEIAPSVQVYDLRTIFLFAGKTVQWQRSFDTNDIAVLITINQGDHDTLCQGGSWTEVPWTPVNYLPRWYDAPNPRHSRWVVVHDHDAGFGISFGYNQTRVQWRHWSGRYANDLAVLVENPSMYRRFSWTGSNEDPPATPLGYRARWIESRNIYDRRWILVAA
jgi:hypothetical protein